MLINRCSDAAPPIDVKRCMAILRSAELHGLKTINGLSCYTIGTSKVLHHELFDSVGVESPTWVQITCGNTLEDIVQVVERSKGKRVYNDYPAWRTFYVKDPRGDHVSIHGDKVRQIKCKRLKDLHKERKINTSNFIRLLEDHISEVGRVLMI